MSFSPVEGVGMLWQLTCTLLGAAVTARAQGNPARTTRHRRARPGTAEARARRHAKRFESPATLVVVPPPDRVTGTFAYAVLKRAFDVAIGAIFLIAAAPLMGAIALGIAMTLGRPILFSQQRVGRGGRLFWLCKFRTLERRPIERSEVEWSAAASHPFATLLRRSGLDELPQLMQVLRGEMSLVGPRPERPHFVKVFEQELPRYAARHHLEAGITGWAQVQGLRGDTSIRRRLEHDLFYLRHWSLGLDVRILLLTVRGLSAALWSLGRGRQSDGDAGVV
jgi:lipopolysaccharide/colanic/teichoic acid biosynthesis glycosyltransferase